MKNTILLFLLTALVLGCSRYIDSPDLTQKLPKQPPTPVNLKLTHLPDHLTLSWQVPDTAASKYFKIYWGDSLRDAYRIWDSTSTFSKNISGLAAGRNYFFKVSVVSTDNLEGTMSSAIFTNPGMLSVIINNDDVYTRSRNVTIDYVVPVTATQVQLSERADFAGAHWENYSPGRDWTLSDGDGTKRVYAKFIFGDGSESSGAIADSIILDTKAMIDTVYFAASSNLQPGDVVTFYLDSGEPGGSAQISFTGVASLVLFDDGTEGDILARDGIYTRRFIIPVNLELVNGIVTGKFHDAAGNAAEDRIAPALLNISKPPNPVTLTATAETSSSIRLNWSQSGENDFASYQIYRNTTSAVTNNSQLVSIISSRTTVTYTDSNLDANKGYFYRIYVYDNSGLSAGSNVAADTTQVNTAPTAVALAVLVQDSASILTWSANSDDDFSSYRVYRDTIAAFSETTGRLLTIINGRSETSFTDIRPDALKYYYKVYVYDRQGALTGSNVVSAP